MAFIWAALRIAGGATCGVRAVRVPDRAVAAPRGSLPGVWPTPGWPSRGVALCCCCRGVVLLLHHMFLFCVFFSICEYMMMDPSAYIYMMVHTTIGSDSF